jgi:putative tryptophan/tyrosine transport system substrate-binding protein
MDRRRFLLTSVGGALAAPLAGEAQQAGRVRLVAALWAVPQHVAAPYRAALESGLEGVGWVVGWNIRLEHRFHDAPDRVPVLAAELVGLRPDVIFAAVNPVIQAVML